MGMQKRLKIIAAALAVALAGALTACYTPGGDQGAATTLSAGQQGTAPPVTGSDGTSQPGATLDAGMSEYDLSQPQNAAYKASYDAFMAIGDDAPDQIQMHDNIYIEEKDASIYLLDKSTGSETLLLAGINTDDEDYTAYLIFTRIDDSRFVYFYQTQETQQGWGVYDVSAMKDSPALGDPARSPAKYQNNRVYSLAVGIGAPFNMAVTDIGSMQTTQIFDSLITNDNDKVQYFAYSPDGQSVAILTYQSLSHYKIYYCSLNSYSLIRSYTLVVSYCDPEFIEFHGNGTLYIYTAQHDAYDEYMYTINLS